MRYAILGPGGVGGLIGGLLARARHPVTLLVRPETVDDYPDELRIRSSVVGSFSVAVEHAAALERPVDVVFLTTKSTALPGALEAVSPAALGNGVLIPLLNGVAHVQLLRERYGLGAWAYRGHRGRRPASRPKSGWPGIRGVDRSGTAGAR